MKTLALFSIAFFAAVAPALADLECSYGPDQNSEEIRKILEAGSPETRAQITALATEAGLEDVSFTALVSCSNRNSANKDFVLIRKYVLARLSCR